MTIGSMENVEVFGSEGKGRGLKATKEFWAADVIFAERAYSAVVFDSLVNFVCHTCFKRQEKLHRCGQCKFAHYCDRTCQKDAWLNHKSECSAVRRLGKAPSENIRCQTGMYLPLSLEDREEAALPEPLGCWSPILPVTQRLTPFWVVRTWAPLQSRPQPSASCPYFLDDGFPLGHEAHLGSSSLSWGQFCRELLPRGSSVLLLWSPVLVARVLLTPLLPSCSRIELRALGKISEGEELTVSYIDFLNVSEERRRQLKRQYYFDCTCDHCQKGLKDDLFLGVKEDPKPSPEAVKEMIQFSKDMLEKIDKARSEGLYHEVVKLCRESLQKQEPVFADTNLYTLRMLSIVSEVLSYLQAFGEASHYARRMVDGYMKLYHPNNAQLGMAVMRAGLTNWHAGHIEVGHGMICKAYAILLGMRVQTEMELRMFRQNEFMYHKMREAALNNQPMQVMAEPSNEPAPTLFHKKP
ncbi:Histone-lysine N-methyltransferase Smyd1 [Sciurus carolinensis]|uniref:[histone H3]-lysine(4) N-trimethyltransferase n=1 Tax=Sciurus carolinensis TaxID=30640 RepID=A0AA41NCA8_SCICA|nr:Histone-lysine N-methyltransferase Smyd1 [Sciurus carolinensis]